MEAWRDKIATFDCRYEPGVAGYRWQVRLDRGPEGFVLLSELDVVVKDLLLLLRCEVANVDYDLALSKKREGRITRWETAEPEGGRFNSFSRTGLALSVSSLWGVCLYPAACVVMLMIDSSISEKLSEDDDPMLWDLAVSTILGDAENLCADVRDEVFAQIGRCRHWISPHRPIRWTAGGGFSWPFGYDKTTTGYSYTALPELEWSSCFRWMGNNWEVGRTGRRCMLLRVAIPARTLKHLQAAIHTIWMPRAPLGKEKAVQLYGFRKVEGTWSLTASQVLLPRKK